MGLQLNDLSRHYESIAKDIDAAVLRVLKSGWYLNGVELEAFEHEFADYCGVKHCVGVGNGTDALEIALRALGVRAGDEVLTVANAGGFSTIAIRALGAIPVFVDVEPVRLTMSPTAIPTATSPRTKAMVVTHLFGRLAAMDEIVPVARQAGLKVLEDCAQAHGARRDGRHAGGWGDAATFSFYPAKNLGAFGDGGAIVSGDRDVAQRARTLRQYGWSQKYTVELDGGRNSRLDEIQAAVLRAKLPHLDKWNEQRREVARWYADDIRHPRVALPSLPQSDDVVHLYVLRTAARDSLARHLGNEGIPFGTHYPIPDPRQKAWRTDFEDIGIRETVTACSQILTLPCFPELTRAEVFEVSAAVNSWKPAD